MEEFIELVQLVCAILMRNLMKKGSKATFKFIWILDK